MQAELNFDAVIAKLAGVAGAALSLNFIKGSWAERLTMAAGGAVISLYVTAWLSQKTGLPEGLTGFLLGMFGMAITAKAWEAIQATPVAEIWKSGIDYFLRKK
jgi:hypothetical protein